MPVSDMGRDMNCCILVNPGHHQFVHRTGSPAGNHLSSSSADPLLHMRVQEQLRLEAEALHSLRTSGRLPSAPQPPPPGSGSKPHQRAPPHTPYHRPSSSSTGSSERRPAHAPSASAKQMPSLDHFTPWKDAMTPQSKATSSVAAPPLSSRSEPPRHRPVIYHHNGSNGHVSPHTTHFPLDLQKSTLDRKSLQQQQHRESQQHRMSQQQQHHQQQLQQQQMQQQRMQQQHLQQHQMQQQQLQQQQLQQQQLQQQHLQKQQQQQKERQQQHHKQQQQQQQQLQQQQLQQQQQQQQQQEQLKTEGGSFEPIRVVAPSVQRELERERIEKEKRAKKRGENREKQLAREKHAKENKLPLPHFNPNQIRPRNVCLN